MADYQPDFRGNADLMRSPEMYGLVEYVAHEAIPFAKAISPDYPPYGSGYVSSFEVNRTTVRIKGVQRAAAELANTAEYATAVELGNFNAGEVRGHHVLRRTADEIESRYG